MATRAWCLLGTLLAAPAWADDPAPPPPPIAPVAPPVPAAPAPPVAPAPPNLPAPATATSQPPPAPPAAPAGTASPTAFRDATDQMWRDLENLPPRHSYDFALDVSYGDITYWRVQQPPWLGFGLRGNWGAHVGSSRFGATLGFRMEGPVPEYYTLALEPGAIWDTVRHRVLVGASLGPAFMYHRHTGVTSAETVNAEGIGPWAAVRLGVSQPWSRVARRMFAAVEPKVRFMQTSENGWAWDPAVSIVIGSGRGY